MNHQLVVCLAAGSMLTVAGCGSKSPPPPRNPPAPEIVEVPPEVVPDVEVLPPMNPPAMPPRWEDVKSSHPEGATNPPSPVLVVDAATKHCYKRWGGGMTGPTPDEVRADCSDGSCGTLTLCPDDGRAAALLAEYESPPKRINPPPPNGGKIEPALEDL